MDPVRPVTLRPPTRDAWISRLATPGGRVLMALLLLVAIWLPSVLLAHGLDPEIVVVNAILTSASLLVLTSRRPHRPNRSTREGSPPHA